MSLASELARLKAELATMTESDRCTCVVVPCEALPDDPGPLPRDVWSGRDAPCDGQCGSDVAHVVYRFERATREETNAG